MILALPTTIALSAATSLAGAAYHAVRSRFGVIPAAVATLPIAGLWLVSVGAIVWVALVAFLAFSGAVLVALVVEAARWSWRWL